MHRSDLRNAGIFVFGWVVLVLGMAASSRAVDLYNQNFDSLTLKPVVTFDSELRNRAAWTEVPPTGWINDDSGIATVGNPNSGVLEFEGWRFVDKDWWIATSGNQGRSQFANGGGIVAVADPDEWDDFPSAAGFPSPDDEGGCTDINLSACFSARLKTPAISLAGVAANQAKVFFHSSWLDEDAQKATLTAKYNNGTDIEIFQWDSRKELDNGMGGKIPNPNFKDDGLNEGLTYNLANPAGATSVQLEFRLFDARNDWWWAFDNLKVFTGDAPSADGALRAIIDRTTESVKIVNRTGQTVNIRGYSLRSSAGAFEEAEAAFLSDTDPNWLQATRLGDPANDLSEVHLNSAPIANLAEINFGNVWRKFYRDSNDITFNYLLEGSDDPVQGILEFTGNAGKSYDFLDLNYSGSVEIGDWNTFKAGFSGALTGQPEVVRHNLGDLDNDSLHTVQDFLEFERRYNAINGAGALALAIAGVPEPGTALLACFGVAGILAVGRRRSPAALPCLAVIIVAIASAFTAAPAQAQLTVFFEDFESVPLGATVEELPAAPNVWSGSPPTGWTLNNTGMPGFGDPTTDGTREWAGWSFANKDWWIKDDRQQGRQEFTRGQGTVMIADPDEWQDRDGDKLTPIATAPTPDNFYDSFVTTKTINIPAGIPSGRLKLSFDSSWLPEGFDDLDKTNNQTATIKVKYNNRPKLDLVNWDSDNDPDNAFFHDNATNERVSGLDMDYDGISTSLTLEFGMTNSWNDWWWAVDNVAVEVPANPSVLRIDTVTGRGFLVGGDVISTTIKTVTTSSVNGVLTGNAATGLSGAGLETVDGPDPGSVAGDFPGEQWEKLATEDPSKMIFEAFLHGSSTFNNSRTVNLGSIFNPATPIGQRDVKFNYTTAAGDLIEGTVEYFAAPGVQGDYNNNGIVDAADYTVWRDHLGSTFALNNEGATPGQVTVEDYNLWKANFGDSAAGAGGASGTTAVPEPAAAWLFVIAAVVSAFVSRPGRRMSLASAMLIVLGAVTQFAGSAQAVTLDRNYRMGEADAGTAGSPLPATVGSVVGQARDSAGVPGMQQIVNLVGGGNVGGSPRYVAITDRPDGVTNGIGIRLNQVGAEQQYIKTDFLQALNFPEQSISSTLTPGGTIDYQFINDRGFQLWAKPTALPTASPVTNSRFDIVMDTNQHGVSIDLSGKFVMRYAYNDYVSSKSASANTWYHVSVVRPFGENNGSILYVNGEAVAAAKGRYNMEKVATDEPGTPVDEALHDTSPLVVGANTGIGPTNPATDPRPQTPVPSTTNFFRGIVDDLEMFVMGMNNSNDFGEYVFQNDNDYAAHFKPSNPVDLTGEGTISFADAQVFASNWLFENTLKWVDPLENDQSLIVGDLLSRSKGDFNFDGRVDLADWGMLNTASPGAGAAAMQLILGGGVPEPGSVFLAAIAGTTLAFGRRRRNVGVDRPRQYCGTDNVRKSSLSLRK